MTRLHIACITVLSAFVASAAFGQGPYRLDIIDLPLGGSGITNAGMNEHGDICTTTVVNGRAQGFVALTNGSIRLLPPSAPYARSFANSISDAGLVVGTMREVGSTLDVLTYWTEDNVPHIVPDPVGHSSPYGIDIEIQGRICGWANTSVPGEYDSFYWAPESGYTVLPLLNGALRRESRAYATNDAGMVVGYCTNSAGHFAPYRWSAAAGIAEMSSISEFDNYAVGINSNGMAASYSLVATSTWRATIWAADGTAQDLGTLSAWRSSGAYDVSEAGTVVGDVFMVTSRATIWTPSEGLRFLSSEIPNGTDGWTLDTATGITEDGRYIFGLAHNASGEPRVFRLTRAPSCPADLDEDGSIGLTDLAILLTNFGLSDASAAQGDLDGDHDVDLVDLAGMLIEFGSPC